LKGFYPQALNENNINEMNLKSQEEFLGLKKLLHRPQKNQNESMLLLVRVVFFIEVYVELF